MDLYGSFPISYHLNKIFKIYLNLYILFWKNLHEVYMISLKSFSFITNDVILIPKYDNKRSIKLVLK